MLYCHCERSEAISYSMKEIASSLCFRKNYFIPLTLKGKV